MWLLEPSQQAHPFQQRCFEDTVAFGLLPFSCDRECSGLNVNCIMQGQFWSWCGWKIYPLPRRAYTHNTEFFLSFQSECRHTHTPPT